ncbi:MAG TPA: GvpL/GvpF family gas vesicle protein [Kribbella sp.]|nr:GvpL/GvpF family gas vesicle protein [Kribbella sp.]
MPETGAYIYAAARHLEPGSLDDLTGLDDAPLRILRQRDLVAIVSTVDLDEYGEEALRRHFEELEWLERVARRHDEVIRAVWRVSGLVAPFRLATICRTDENVRDRLDSRYDELTRALDRVEARSEWSVKAFLPTESAMDVDEEADSTGTAYLLRRRHELDQKRRAAVDAEALAEEIHREVADAAQACRRLPPQDRKLTGYADPMILNGSYLVDDRDADAFRSLIDQLMARRPAVRLTVDGPWPPYSFTTLETT